HRIGESRFFQRPNALINQRRSLNRDAIGRLTIELAPEGAEIIAFENLVVALRLALIHTLRLRRRVFAVGLVLALQAFGGGVVVLIGNDSENVHVFIVQPLAFLVDRQTQTAPDLLPARNSRDRLFQRADLKDVRVVPAFA